MLVLAWMVGLVALGQAPNPANPSSDAVTLRDGKVVLGQVVDSDRRGPMMMLVRRDWAKANLPDRLATWSRQEAPITLRATTQLRERLANWRRERAASPKPGDRITTWLDAELARMLDPSRAGDSPLIVARIARNEVKATVRRSRNSTGALRLGWLMKLEDVETMSFEDLKQTLEGQGYAVDGGAAVSVDALLPPQAESDAHWLARRAATELAHDPGGRFVRYQDLVLPEPAPGEAIDAGAGLNAAVSTIKNLLGEPSIDPLPDKLRDLAARGRVGAVVTRLNLASDFSSVAVESALWVRTGPDRWSPVLSKSSTANPNALAANAGAPLAEDPQVKAVFGLVSSLGLGEVSPELKQRSLNMGLATQKALGEVRASLNRELEPLVLSLDMPKVAGPPGVPSSKP